MSDVDDLAQFIRRVDGDHTMGAGALAEAIVAYQMDSLLADDVIERAARAAHEHAWGWPMGHDEELNGTAKFYRDQTRAALAAALGEDES